MDLSSSQMDPAKRVSDLLGQYGDQTASLAWLLCDRHDPVRVAYDIVDSTLQTDRMTYGDLKRESETFAAGLASLGVRQGDRVATLAGKSKEYLIALMAIWRLGAVHVPLFTAFAPPAIALRLSGSNATVVICDAAQLPKLQPGVDVQERPTCQAVVIGGTDRDVASELSCSFQSVLEADGPPVLPAVLSTTSPPACNSPRSSAPLMM